jgi:hypothetical protein
MGYVSVHELLPNSRQGRFAFFDKGRAGPLNQFFGWLVTIEVTQRFTSPRPGQELVMMEVDGQRLEPGTILHRLADVSRKFRFGLLTTLRTRLDCGLMFGHLQPAWRDIEYLSTLTAGAGHTVEVGATMRAYLQAVRFNMVRFLDLD